jgi:hypothetical protein
MLATVVAFVVAAVAAVTTGPVDAGTVQAAYVVEVVAGSKCVVDASGHICGAGRRFELKGIDRARALSLVNANSKAAPRGCAQKTRHAFVFETTKGVRAVEVNFGCHALGGRAMSKKAERELASFFRLYGLVNGLSAGL